MTKPEKSKAGAPVEVLDLAIGTYLGFGISREGKGFGI
jgi:hypothetical protein